MTAHIGNLTITTQANNKFMLTVYCVDCDERFTKRGVDPMRVLTVAAEYGVPIQEIFPDWNPWERELFFMTNRCNKCYPMRFDAAS